MQRPARVPAQLSESLHKRLNAYALAAGAAGVGVLALAQLPRARLYTRLATQILRAAMPQPAFPSITGSRSFASFKIPAVFWKSGADGSVP